MLRQAELFFFNAPRLSRSHLRFACCVHDATRNSSPQERIKWVIKDWWPVLHDSEQQPSEVGLRAALVTDQQRRYICDQLYKRYVPLTIALSNTPVMSVMALSVCLSIVYLVLRSTASGRDIDHFRAPTLAECLLPLLHWLWPTKSCIGSVNACILTFCRCKASPFGLWPQLSAVSNIKCAFCSTTCAWLAYLSFCSPMYPCHLSVRV